MYRAEAKDGYTCKRDRDFDTFEEARDWCEERMANADEVLADDDYWYGERAGARGETIELWASIEFWEDEDDAPTQDAINEYLCELRDSGVTNMFGAGSYVADEFDISSADASKALVAWMQSFDS